MIRFFLIIIGTYCFNVFFIYGEVNTSIKTEYVEETFVDANDDLIIIQENSFSKANVLNNDFLGHNQELKEITIVRAPRHGQIKITDSHHILYTPDASYVGLDYFEYQICNSADVCGSAAVKVEVKNVDYYPTAFDDEMIVPYSKDKTLNILENDEGLEDLGLTLTITSEPQHASISITKDLQIDYKSERGYEGEDSFSYRICDAENDCSEANVSITINSPEQDDFFIPNAISPNGDGLNDEFYIPDLKSTTNVTIYIYNQWGNIVFKSNQYQNNWNGISNSGSSSGKSLPSGTYFYKIELPEWKTPFTGYIYIQN